MAEEDNCCRNLPSHCPEATSRSLSPKAKSADSEGTRDLKNISGCMVKMVQCVLSLFSALV